MQPPPRAGGILDLDVRGRITDLRRKFVPSETLRSRHKPLDPFRLRLLDEFFEFLIQLTSPLEMGTASMQTRLIVVTHQPGFDEWY